MKKLALTIVLFSLSSYVAAGIAPPAPPPPVSFTVSGGHIPDNGGATACESPFTGALVLNFDVNNFQFVGVPSAFVSLRLNHTFAGDLIATLIAPDGSELSLFGRVGVDRASSLGSPANFSETEPYVFGGSFANQTDLWLVTEGLLDNQVIPTGSFITRESGNQLLNDGEVPPSTDSSAAFANLSTPNGQWRLCIADAASRDTGNVVQAQLTLNNIVELEDLCIPIRAQNGATALICL